MRAFSISFILCFAIFSFPYTVIAQEGASGAAADKGVTGYLLFQVIKEQFVFDNNSIKSASLVMRENGAYVGLKVVLKPFAVSEFEKLTTAGIGKPANLVFDKKIISTRLIQTPIGGTVLISGLTQEQAQSFLKTLTQIERRHFAEKQVERMPND